MDKPVPLLTQPQSTESTEAIQTLWVEKAQYWTQRETKWSYLGITHTLMPDQQSPY